MHNLAYIECPEGNLLIIYVIKNSNVMIIAYLQHYISILLVISDIDNGIYKKNGVIFQNIIMMSFNILKSFSRQQRFPKGHL